MLARFFILLLCISSFAHAGVEGGIQGHVVDTDEIAVGQASVNLTGVTGQVKQSTLTSLTGDFRFFPIEIGSYNLEITAPGLQPYKVTVTVSSGTSTEVQAHLSKAEAKELVVEVREKRNLVHVSSASSTSNISKETIDALPQGQDASLPKLISTTTPGVIAGPFGQMFIRGNHANIQYQIDGVQLPESTSGSFGEAISPRVIDHMEVITGGVPAEYGERLAAVMNIVTKSGQEKPMSDVEFTYGTYNASTKSATTSGANEKGNIHYYISMKADQTDRGLDTPQPVSTTNQMQGGLDAVHDMSTGDNEFVRIDDVLDNSNKLIFTGSNSYRFYQIPNFPDAFNSNDPYFSANYADQFGNSTGSQSPAAPLNNYAPSGTNDTQTEQNTFAQVVWKHTISDHSFLQIAPYYKLSSIVITNDPNNDLMSASLISGASPTSLALNRYTNNYGMKADYTQRADDRNLWKAGVQYQYSQSMTNNLSIQTSLATPPTAFSGRDDGQLFVGYVQDSFAMTPKLTWNLGLRFSQTQFVSSGVYDVDSLLQPRVGLEYLWTERTKLHAFYGKLFQPAPFEDLREAFVSVGGGQPTPYDLKAEKDDYAEVGITQSIGQTHSINVVYYYKLATNMLDDSQLLNTSIAQPYNFSQGYADGVEVSFSGAITNNVSDFLNYAYEDAKGEGVSGGIFAFSPSNIPSSSYQYLDHVQVNTATAGIMYKIGTMWSTVSGLYGSGLRTGFNNSLSLPSHLTFDWTLGYTFPPDSNWSGATVAVDWLNITDNSYPITINNGYNGNHYAAGTQLIGHIGKEF